MCLLRSWVLKPTIVTNSFPDVLNDKDKQYNMKKSILLILFSVTDTLINAQIQISKIQNYIKP